MKKNYQKPEVELMKFALMEAIANEDNEIGEDIIGSESDGEW